MNFNIKEKCDSSGKKEFFYGAKINKKIQDVFLGLCYLEPKEENRKVGPGKGHEELLYLINGKIKIKSKKTNNDLSEGEVFFIPNGQNVLITNLIDKRSYFVIAGGHTKYHSH
ncbi:MAG: hypothetical protein ACFFAS_06445 [Promethearchaeota archaeon]